ncbi:hypothetical protein K493DRAFT_337247 [Basidiobolus meristosporus CBS 931.73]|uniref:Xylanolytic transcriptional activator regulatory domain-containing protein n=1 Tax=Basidiobolus meristosporus CBS 931.73 TaxID=1314790 RepID=A0A1Y1YCH3_9FUNG|nr:hypothetical protein K493DRAFT_337247 [Basidiobolus meristosporus CBS 931.73]|eukprot:ORX95687.1 hypothetical protein K493DRAFT_337247 [Basidiobolus meristosporus CBS 931.73]
MWRGVSNLGVACYSSAVSWNMHPNTRHTSQIEIAISEHTNYHSRTCCGSSPQSYLAYHHLNGFGLSGAFNQISIPRDFLKKRGPRGNCPIGLEKRIKRLEALLLNLKDKDPQLYHQICSSNAKEELSPTESSSKSENVDTDEFEIAGDSLVFSEDIYTLERALGELTTNEKDQCRYLGPSSGAYLFEGVSFYKRGIFRDVSMISDTQSNLKVNYPRTKEDFDYVCDITNNFPPVDVRKHLLDIYFTHQHPYFPIFHKKWFLTRLESGQKLSGALLNAVFAVACLHSGDLTMYQNPTQPGIAGDAFFHRAKKCLDNGWYASSVDDIQALLLLAFHPTHSWHFLGNAIRMAQDLGLHRNLLDKGGVNDIEKENRRRAWWGCYVLDRICSSGTGRPMSIDEADYDTVLKFYEETQTRPSSENEDTPISLRYFVQLIKLCTLQGKVLKAIYPVRNTSALSSEDVLWILNKSLNHWHSCLPSEFQLVDTDMSTSYNPFASILNALFHSNIICLHRPFIPRPTSRFDTISPSLHVCNHSASIINSIYFNTPWQFIMHGCFFLCFPYFHASMIFMVSAYSKDLQLANTSLVNLSICVQKIKGLRSSLHQASTMFLFLQDILNSRGLKLMEETTLTPIILPLDQASFSKSIGTQFSRRSDSETMIIFSEPAKVHKSRPMADTPIDNKSVATSNALYVNSNPTARNMSIPQGPIEVFRNQAWNYNFFPNDHSTTNPLNTSFVSMAQHSAGEPTVFANPAYWNNSIDSELQQWNSYIGQYTMDNTLQPPK